MTTERDEEVDLQLSALVSSAAGFPIQVKDPTPYKPPTKSIIRMLFGRPYSGRAAYGPAGTSLPAGPA
jgi:hypothetical protein